MAIQEGHSIMVMRHKSPVAAQSTRDDMGGTRFHQDGDTFYNDATGERVSSIAMRVVTTVREPLLFNGQGIRTVGDIIDEMLTLALDAGDTVEDIHLDISPTEWSAMQETHSDRNARAAGMDAETVK
jgi:hypothetical protein